MNPCHQLPRAQLGNYRAIFVHIFTDRGVQSKSANTYKKYGFFAIVELKVEQFTLGKLESSRRQTWQNEDFVLSTKLRR